MHLFVVSFASLALALASHAFFEDVHTPPAAHTCNLWDEDRLLVKHPVCPGPGPDPLVSTTPAYVGASPWTQSPICTTTAGHPDLFCVFTSSTFAAGRGISVVSSPAAAKYLTQSAAFTHPADVPRGVNVEADPPYTVQPVPGRGMGVIVNRTLHRGDSIFSYMPVVILHRKTYDLLSDTDRLHFQREAVERLPARTRALFLSLHGHFGGEKVDDILETNSFRLDLGEEDDSHTMVLPETSASAWRINHDCRPNAHYYFDLHTMTHHVVALRTIHTGEELTISYTDGAALREDRQAAIRLSWGFDCSCSLCTQHEHLVRESDRRLELIAELEKHLEDWSDESPATPEMAERLVSLYEQERLYAPIAVAYVYAALAYNAVGSEQLAMKHAALAVEATMLNSGPDFSDVDSMRELMEKPKSHWSWKMRVH